MSAVPRSATPSPISRTPGDHDAAGGLAIAHCRRSPDADRAARRHTVRSGCPGARRVVVMGHERDCPAPVAEGPHGPPPLRRLRVSSILLNSPFVSRGTLCAARATPAISRTVPVSSTTITSGPVQATSPTEKSADFPGATPAQLLAFVRRIAADADLVAALPLDPQGRIWVRLEGPGGSEAWLIGWPPGAGTGWHDHAESIGAFTTAVGELTENALAVRLPADGWRSVPGTCRRLRPPTEVATR
ncbi:hypothetical protein QFZ68_000067 [Streptomyces sp. V1I6]|nr:hypothetical protein [Streptomyces sp. V1I6]